MGTGLRRCDKIFDVGIGREGSKYGIEEFLEGHRPLAIRLAHMIRSQPLVFPGLVPGIHGTPAKACAVARRWPGQARP